MELLRPNRDTRTAAGLVRLYWIVIGLFALLFVISIALTVGDLEGSYTTYQRLGFPMWAVYFNAVAKVLGLAAILYNRSRTLKDFAFAGFLYDLLLALCAHLALGEADVLLALLGLGIWVFAFLMDRRVFTVQDAILPR